MWAVQYHRYGGPEVLQRDEVPLPALRPNEALIETVSSGVSAIDLMYRSGQLRVHGIGFPKQPGFDVLGVVRDSRIPGIDEGRWAWAVLGLEPAQRRGTAVEFLRVDASRLGVFPEGYEPTPEAGSLPLGALTALKSLQSTQITAGQRLLVVGAAGAVGTPAIQLARAQGVTVDAVAGHAGLDLCHQLGASEVIDYSTSAVHAAQNDGNYDAVIVAAGRGKDWLQAANDSGRIVFTHAGNWARTLPPALLRRRRISGVAAGHSNVDLTRLAQQVATDNLRPTVGRMYSINDLARAHQEYGEDGTVGARLVLHH